MCGTSSVCGRRRSEAGFTLIWATIFIGLLLGIAGFSIDLGNWYLQFERAQRAADAAAAAGSPYLPGATAEGVAAANAVLSANGWQGKATYVGADPTRPWMMKVTLASSVDNTFLQFLGMPKFSFARSGFASYSASIPMGSPNNVLGMEPAAWPQWRSNDTIVGPTQFFLSIGGSGMEKENGDRWSTGRCDTGAPDFCKSTGSGVSANLEYSAKGQSFTVHVAPNVSGTLAIEAYDPLFANTGVYCDSAALAEAHAALGNPLYSPDQMDLCAGDNQHGSAAGKATFSVEDSACKPMTFSPLDGDGSAWISALSKTSSDPTAPVNAFRRWVRLCEINIPNGSTHRSFSINVKQTPGSTASNRFSLRAALVHGEAADAASSRLVSLTGDGRLVVQTKGDSSTLMFSVARLSPSSAGRTVHVELYDIADSTQPVSSLTLMPSNDSTNGGTPLTTFACTQELPKTHLKVDRASCTVLALDSATYNAKVTSFDIAVPPEYSCDYTTSTGCWIKMRLEYGAGAHPWDTTSWSVGEKGSPVRLYNN